MDKMHNILIVDDDEDTLGALRSILEYHDYKVYTCTAADKAKALLKEICFSTILIDIYLQNYNGIDLAAELKEQCILTPIIIITGSLDVETAQRALRLGVFDYLVKPFKNKQLLQVVHNAVLQNRLLEEQKTLDEKKKLYQEELENTVKEQVAKIKESESRYRNLIEQSLVGVYISQDGSFQYLNDMMISFLESSESELTGKSDLADFVVNSQKERFNLFLKKVIEENISDSFTVNVVTAGGNEKIFEVWAGRIIYKNNPAIEGMVHDKTEHFLATERQRNLEIELMHEHKLAAIGQLAAGIAHNINTPISVIQGIAELIRLQHPELDDIEKILKQTARLSELINSVLSKSRKDQDVSVVSINLNKLLEEELEFFNSNLFYKHNIKKEFDFAEQLPLIKGVYGDFTQALDNIIQNAIDAVYNSDEKRISISTALEENYIILKIADTGSGIDEADYEKIFNPFFTTKPNQQSTLSEPYAPRGTGLGLSQAYTLLFPYGIKIDIESQKGNGTEFIIRIPIDI